MAKDSSSKNLPSKMVRSILKIAGLRKATESSHTLPLRQADGKENPPSLGNLPVEIVLMIADQLDIVDQVCLQSTSRFFRQLVKVDRTALDGDRCRKWAITCCFETDMKKYPAKVACAFCKTIRKKKMFNDVQEWTLFGLEGRYLHLRHKLGSAPEWGMMTYSPMGRWCKAHNKDRYSTLSTLRKKSLGGFLLDGSPRPRWTRFQVLRCWHCAQCIPDNDVRTNGCLQCLCDFCPRFDDWHYFRAGPCEPGEGQYKYEFVRKSTGQTPSGPRGPCPIEMRFVAEVGSKYYHLHCSIQSKEGRNELKIFF